MDVDDVRGWVDRYLDAFAMCVRGDAAPQELLEFYGVPIVLTMDAGARVLEDDDAVIGALARQTEGLRAAGYDRSETLDSETAILSATTALHTAAFSRVRADGSEINRLRATYLIVDGPQGRRMSALVVHGG